LNQGHKEYIVKILIKLAALTVIIVFSFACTDDESNGGGKNWTAVSDSTFGNSAINTITWGDDIFIAAGAGGKIARSADGKNWTAVSDSTFGNNSINVITYGNGRFFAGGESGRMAFSTDKGVSWTAVENTTFGSNNVNGIAWGGNNWIAVGSLRMARSDNAEGTSWTGSSSNIPFDFLQGAPNLRDIIFANNRFVIVGAAGGQGHGASLAHSSNGINWTMYDMEGLSSAPLTGIAFGSGKFVTVSENTILYSSNGSDWSDVEEGTLGKSLLNIAAGAGKFIAVGSRGANLSSTDGIKWTALPDFAQVNFRDITYGNGTWVAVGLNGAIAYFKE
jgi:hypothetical protein